MHTNATDFKNHLGKYIAACNKAPVIVEKSGQPSAVLISYEEYEKLSQYEEMYWGHLAAKAEKEGYLGVKQTASRLKKLAERAGIKIKNDDETA